MEVSSSKDYSYLIQPIRDLAENWQIDISKELEDYLTDLDKISFTFEGTNQIKTYNFAEAALLIQGSAVIYSKKVEYLYSLLYQTLDLLAQKKKRKDNTSITADGIDRDVQDENDIEFLALDDILEADENIDLNDGEEDDETSGKNKNKKKSRLVDTEEHTNDSTYKIALMNNSGSSADRMLMIDNPDNDNGMMDTDSNDINGKANDLKRSDFRMNDAIVSRSGAVVLRGLDFLDHESFLSTKPSSFQKIQYDGDDNEDHDGMIKPMALQNGKTDYLDENTSIPPLNGNAPTDPTNTSILPPNGDDGSGFENVGNEDYSDDDNGDGDGIDMQHDDSPQPDGATTNVTPNKEVKEEEKVKKQAAVAKKPPVTSKDSWKLLNPFDDDLKSKPKPFKKGKTFNIPFNCLESKDKKKKKDDTTTNTTEVKPTNELKLLSFSTEPIIILPTEILPLRGSFFKELTYLYSKYNQQLKSDQRKKRNGNSGNGGNDEIDKDSSDYEDDIKTQEKIARRQENTFTEENINGGDGDGDGGDIGLAYDDDYEDDDYGDMMGGATGGDDETLNTLPHHNGPFELGDNNQYNFSQSTEPERFKSENGVDIELSRPTQTYEELCRSYVEKYLESASKYVRETALSSRVNDWNNKLMPILVEQDSHPSFDIHVYGDKFLNGMKPLATTSVKKHETIEIQDDDDDNDDDVIIIDKEATVSFGEITANSPVYEVCRMFTSCLQLANNGNIQIISNNKQIDTLNFHLLSLEKKHINDMVVPSQSGNPSLFDDIINDEKLEKERIQKEKKEKDESTIKKPTRKQSKKKPATNNSTKRASKRLKKDESEDEEDEQEDDDEEEQDEEEEEEQQSSEEEISSDDEKVKKKLKTTSKKGVKAIKSKPKPKSSKK